VAAAGILAVAGLGVAPAPAAAWTAGVCPTSSGVTVVVDFTAFGAGVVTRCAPGAHDTGLDVLTAAGLAVAYAGPGFVCRIDGLPGPDREACAATPPATAHWTYWHAQRGGSWTYSPVGASAWQPAQGSVEGWAFVDGPGENQPPGVPPPAPPAAPATPRPTAPPTPAATPMATAAPARTAQPVTPGPSPATPSLVPSPVATATPTPSASAVPSTTADPGTAEPTASAGVAARASSRNGPSPAVGTAVGIGLVLAVAGTAVAANRGMRRRQHG
jgi:hypothetical protein